MLARELAGITMFVASGPTARKPLSRRPSALVLCAARQERIGSRGSSARVSKDATVTFAQGDWRYPRADG